MLPLLNASMTYRDNFFFSLLPFCSLPVWVFETASLWLLSETVFCYGTVCSKYFNLFKYSYICTACSAKLMQILPGMFLRSVMSKCRSAGLIRLNNRYRSHSKSKAVLKLCILSVLHCSECTATGKNTFWDYGCDFAYFMVFKQRVTDQLCNRNCRCVQVGGINWTIEHSELCIDIRCLDR